MILTNYIKTNKETFISKLQYISDELNINPDWLLMVMFLESGINHRAVNKTGGATGLIQFMPSTAAWLGTTTTALLQMSNVEQLDFVYKYYLPYKNKLNSFTDLYLVTFFPIALGKDDNYVFQTKDLSAYKIAIQNQGFDLNKDQKITKREFITAILNKVPDIYLADVLKKKTKI